MTRDEGWTVCDADVRRDPAAREGPEGTRRGRAADFVRRVLGGEPLEASPVGRVVTYDDPMLDTYRWVAMLDPVEISRGVDLTHLRVGERAGRETWFARAVPVEGYEPRCSCCPLLWSRISDDIELGGNTARQPYSTDYPEAYDIALDVQTAIVVEVRAIGGRPGLDFEVDVLEVDADLTELVAQTCNAVLQALPR